MRNLKTYFIALSIIVLTISSCKKQEMDRWETLSYLHEQLYGEANTGIISECVLFGDTVFTTTPIAYDAGFFVWATNGEQLTGCSYNLMPREICTDLEDCEVIYARYNSTDPPTVDKYNLSD